MIPSPSFQELFNDDEFIGLDTSVGNMAEPSNIYFAPSRHTRFPRIEIHLVDLLFQVLQTPEKRKRLQSLKGQEALSISGFLHWVLLQASSLVPGKLHKHALIAQYRLCRTAALFPECYFFRDALPALDEPIAEGGFSDIFKVHHREKALCLKAVRVYGLSSADNVLKSIAKEAILWSYLRHPNIVPFWGIYYPKGTSGRRRRICLVSPWMENGNLVYFLRENPDASPAPFIHDVAKGLAYLHDKRIIHGDLKGVNVLINDAGEACLTDFGLSSVRVETTIAYTNGVMSEAQGCTYRWLAPELSESMLGASRRTEASDVWAFGLVCYEIVTRKLPYHELNECQVLREVISGRLPTQPQQSSSDDSALTMIFEQTWELIKVCLEQKPDRRPKSRWIVEKLEKQGLVRCRQKGKPRSSTFPIIHDSQINWAQVESILSGLTGMHTGSI
ncbi:hypothetical protein NP233_g8566 [Leucocoprinus birnbaumii]|uniref:Protein kinase domain-containing protein n=1 Tax=Leucocoprinus birnbaumii TaxID=56174 RepID=A0AAD5VM40_9AGAR|nr:hypothetical protein NP233_g8566 [Leucocoprinus birnbaumii]